MSKQIAINKRCIRRFNDLLNELAEEGENVGEIIVAMNLIAVEASMEAFPVEAVRAHFGGLIELRRQRLAGELACEGRA